MPKTKRPRRLTPKERRFVYEYLRDLNGADAVRRAGYSHVRPDQKAYEILRKHEVRDAIAKAKAEQIEKANLSGVRVLEELRRLAFSDPAMFFHADGRLKRPTELEPEQRAALASFEVVVKNAEAGDGHTDTVLKLKFWNKPQVLETLCQHFGLLEGQQEKREPVPFFVVDRDVAVK